MKKVKLIRTNDGKTITGDRLQFLEFNEEGRGKKLHDTPSVGYSAILDASPYGLHTWMTSVITEVVSDREFNTENSNYTWEIRKNEQ